MFPMNRVRTNGPTQPCARSSLSGGGGGGAGGRSLCLPVAAALCTPTCAGKKIATHTGSLDLGKCRGGFAFLTRHVACSRYPAKPRMPATWPSYAAVHDMQTQLAEGFAPFLELDGSRSGPCLPHVRGFSEHIPQMLHTHAATAAAPPPARSPSLRPRPLPLPLLQVAVGFRVARCSRYSCC